MRPQKEFFRILLSMNKKDLIMEKNIFAKKIYFSYLIKAKKWNIKKD